MPKTASLAPSMCWLARNMLSKIATMLALRSITKV
jgi:hypothetical protein